MHLEHVLVATAKFKNEGHLYCFNIMGIYMETKHPQHPWNYSPLQEKAIPLSPVNTERPHGKLLCPVDTASTQPKQGENKPFTRNRFINLK